MGKIAKAASEKHEATLSPAVSEFIKTSTAIPLHHLPKHLNTFPKRWPFPRGDIYHWIPVLNRFDDILERFNTLYGLTAGPQSHPFSRQLLLRGDGYSSSGGSTAEPSEAVLDSFGFSPEGDRELVETILSFTRLVVEDCGNRSLYASSSRLSELLNTTSNSLLEKTLWLALRLAQRYSASRLRLNGPHLQAIHHPLLAQHYMLDLEKLERIAQPFAKSIPSLTESESKEKDGAKNGSSVPTTGQDLLSMVREDATHAAQWQDYGGVSVEPGPGVEGIVTRLEGLETIANLDSASPPTPTPIRRTSGLGVDQPSKQRHVLGQDDVESAPSKDRSDFHGFSYQQVSSATLSTLLNECLALVPSERHYELLSKLRVARAVPESLGSRRCVVAIRLLAIANLAHIYPEQVLQQKVLQQDSESPRRFQLPHQLCDLIHPPGDGASGIPKPLQSVALETLEALTNHKNKSVDVSAELGISASHGVLPYVVRKAVSESAVDEVAANEFEDRQWRNSLFSLMIAIPKQSPRSGDSFLSSGLVEMLVEALNYRTTKAGIDQPRILTFLDSYIYQTGNGFNALVNAKGLDAISDLFANDVDVAMSLFREGKGMPNEYKTSVTDYQIPFPQQQTLRALVKFFNHVMGFSGAPFDRVLRNLIESSQLLQGLRIVISNPQLYGSNIWSGAVNVFGSFIHNEPTSYAAIAEAGLTKAFLETITKQPLEASSERVSEADSAVVQQDETELSTGTNVGTSKSSDQFKLKYALTEGSLGGVLPSAESIAAIPQAFSAICLNETGMHQFEASKALQIFFKSFINPQHVKSLNSAAGTEVENLGRDLDELARHHPRLKPEIVKLSSQVAAAIAEIVQAEAAVRLFGPKLYYRDEDGHLVVNEGRQVRDRLEDAHEVDRASHTQPKNGDDAATINAEDVEMTDVETSHLEPPDPASSAGEDENTLWTKSQAQSISVSDYVTVYSKFLSGFFSNTSLCTAFADADGIEKILDIATTPALPWDFHIHNSTSRIIRTIHTLVEQKPHLTLPSIVRRAQHALDQLQPFLDHEHGSSYFSTFVIHSTPEIERLRQVKAERAVATMRSLVTVQTTCLTLSRSLLSHNSRSSTLPLTAVNLADMYSRLIATLGKLQTKCVSDLALLQNARNSAVVPSQEISGDQSTSVATGRPSGSSETSSSVAATTAYPTQERAFSVFASTNIDVEARNYRPIKSLLEQIPSAITKFHSVLGKTVLLRRMPTDAYQKQNVHLIGESIAEALVEQVGLCNRINLQIDCVDKVPDSIRKVILAQLKDVLIDPKQDSERPVAQVLAIVALPFKEKGGLRLLGEIAGTLFKETVAYQQSNSDAANGVWSQATEGLWSILELFNQLTNNQVVLDALQTGALSSRLDQRDKPDYFLSHQFLVEIRMEILNAVLPIWNSSDLHTSPESVIAKLAVILHNILEGQGEHGAYKNSDFVPQRSQTVRKPWQIRSQHDLDRLLDKDYDSDLAREALYRCNDSFAAAQEYCAAYKRNTSLARYPVPNSDDASTSDMINDRSTPSANIVSDSNVDDNNSQGTDGRPGNQTLPAGGLQDPLGAIAEDVLRNAGSTILATDTSGSTSSPPAPLSEIRRVKAGNSESVVTIEDLNDKRTDVREKLMDRCLTILDAFQDLIFELAELIAASVTKAADPLEMRQEVASTLVQSLISYQGTENLSQNAKKVAALAHLLGIVLQEKEFFEAAQEELRDNFASLLNFLAIPPDQRPEEAAPWIAQVLLILEHILAEDAQPHQIRWEPPAADQMNVDHPIAELPEPLVNREDKLGLFTRVVELLPRIGKNAALGHAVVRILVILTRDRQLAANLSQKKNMQRLFVMIKQLSSAKDPKFRSGVMLILRHIIEDEDTIRQIMRAEIQAAFDKPQRPIDTTVYTRNMYYLVLRAPEIFVEVTNELLELPKFDRSQSPQTLSLKKIEPSVPRLEAGEPANDKLDKKSLILEDGQVTNESQVLVEKSKAVELKTPVLDNPDGVLHYLLSELLSYKDVEDKEVQTQAQTPAETAFQPETSEDIEMTSDEQSNGQRPSTPRPREQKAEVKKAEEKPQFKAEDHPIYIYRCFILQCLTELLQSYNRTKVEFINFSRKGDAPASTPSKPRSGVLNYLLHTLLPTGNVQHPDDVAAKKKSSTSGWAISVLVSLCSRTSEKGPTKRRDAADVEDEPDLLFVRRFVLEHALKAYKDANASSESFEVKYSKLLAMSDLFDRMLAGRPANPPGYRRAHENQDDNLVPTQKQIAKIMFEKNFIAALTSSISDVDLKLPGAGRVVKYILRPLKLLTHTAIELSLSSDESTSPGQGDDDEISSATSTSDIAAEREETPDFYRNSTLGMFEPGREDDPSSDSSGEEDEDDMYGEEYADDMEYEEEPNDDDVVSDEDEEMEGVEEMGPIEGLPGDMGLSVQMSMDDDDSDQEDGEDMDSDDEEDEDLDEDDDEDEIEIMDEITGDDENASLADGDDEGGDWQDEGEDDMGFVAPEDGVVLELISHRGERIQGGINSRGQAVVSESEEDDDDEIHAFPRGDQEAILTDPSGIEIEDDAVVDEGSEHDEEDEDDDYEEEGLVYGGAGNYAGFEDDDAGLPFFMQGLSAPRRAYRSNIPLWPRTAGEVSGYRSHRPGGNPARINDDGINPLLDRNRLTNPVPATTELTRTGPARIQATLDVPFFTAGGNGGEALDTLRALAANHPTLPDLQHLIEAMSEHTQHHRLHHHPTHPGQPHPPHLSHSIHFTLGTRELQRLTEAPTTSNTQRVATNDPSSSVAFTPMPTAERWQEEARIIFGSAYTEKIHRVINSILRLLVPPAMEAERVRKLAEAAKKADEERTRQLAEKEAQEKKEQEEREAAEQAAIAEAAAAAAREEGMEPMMEADASARTDDEMEGVETSEVQPPVVSTETTAPPAPASRVFTTIRGRQLDITHLGIDLEFLEALPEEMREEVIMGRYAEQRSQAAAAGEEPTAINLDFLDALPPDIREELLQQEAQDRRRREREEARRRAAAANGGPARAEEIDPASFMASLDPALRQSVLAEADEDTLAQLPPDLAAEARALGGHHRRRALDPTRFMADIEQAAADVSRRDLDYMQRVADARSSRRPIVQMLDKSGVATLLRLMFVQVQGTSRNSLNGILRNACGNHQTRGEVVSGLLSILQDGSSDMGAMERNFAQLTLRAKQPSVLKTPQPLKRTPSAQSFNSSEASPLMVIGHCLSALIFLTQSITRLPTFFLTEHELIVGTKGKAKGKGKSKETKVGRYPINALLNLLDRELVIDNPHLMEQLAGLLQIVTQPLNVLLKKDKEDSPTDTQTQIDQTQQLGGTPAEPALASTEQPSTGNADPTSATVIEAAADDVASASTAAVKSGTEGLPESKAEETKKPLIAPEIPEEYLRLVVNLLTARDCSGRTFRDTLSTINNLSSVPNARAVFGQELIGRARQLGKTIQSDLTQLIKALQGAENEMEAQSLALANFSPAGSDQAKLSRILTALDYLFDSRSAENRDMSNKQSESMRETGEDLLTSLYEDPSFSALWHQLSACLSATQQSERYFLNVATILLPLIESLMVVCKRLSLRDSRTMLQKGSAPTTPAPEPALRTIFFAFTNRHKKILNDLVRANPKLMSGSFSVLVKNSSVLEFDNKRNYFNRRLHHRSAEMRHYPHQSLQLNVRRDQVFGDSYRHLHFKKPEEIKYGKLNIRFHNEEGVDAGGVTREWFQVLARQMFNADNALFNPVASDRTTFHPNPLSSINEDMHLHYFKFIGRIIGKALYENRVLDCHFSRAVYKRILGKSCSMKDMETIDLDYTKSLQWMLDNDITDIITETFSLEREIFGAHEIVDLVENGRHIPVTEENKHEYVRLVIEWRLTGSVKEQLEHFLEGFHDIVPAELISIFDEGELELLISGMPEIDVDDWKNNTEYHNYTATSPQIQWFWRAVRSYDKEERAKLLQFVTGTGKVPLNGFKELEGMNGYTRFSIHKDYGNKDRLPSSHTCFNQLDLPEYESYEALRKNLYTAMTTGGEYFGFA